MPEPITWGQLPKSQIDPEKIEEAIARMIKEHNEDESAHLGPGQSLQSHKASEIIDHVAKSIIADKIREGVIDFSKLVADEIMIISCLESLDGWDGDYEGDSGWILRVGNCVFYTGAVAWDFIGWGMPGDPAYPLLDFSKKIFFQTTVQLHSTTSQKAYWRVGVMLWLGFHVEDNNLYANCWGDEGEIDVPISGVDITKPHVYRVIFDPDAGKCDYFVDGVLKATITKGLPTGTDETGPFYHIQTKTNARRKLTVFDVFFSRKR